MVAFANMGWMGYRSITSFRTGVALAQISEFSLILIALGYSLGQVDSAVLSLVTLVAVFTITVSSSDLEFALEALAGCDQSIF